jgi:hypothetical protein
MSYRERSKTGIASNALATVSFTAEYSMNTDSFWVTTKGIFIGLMVLYGIIVVAKMWIWSYIPIPSSAQGVRIFP